MEITTTDRLSADNEDDGSAVTKTVDPRRICVPKPKPDPAEVLTEPIQQEEGVMPVGEPATTTEQSPKKTPLRQDSLLGVADEIETVAADSKPPLGDFALKGHQTGAIPPNPSDASTPSDDMASTKPTVRVSPGDVHLACADAEKVLADTGIYFTSGSTLVRVVDRHRRGVSIERINEQTMRVVLSDMIDWERKGRDKEWARCDPPPGVIQALMFGQDRQHLKELNGLARQPYFGADGKLVIKTGYNQASGIYASFDPTAYRLTEPTRQHAQACLGYLNDLIDGFEFEMDADRSAALCAMFTAVTRPSLPLAPAFNITATTSGSGKSYLAEVISLFAGPEDPNRVSYPSSADEAAKLIVTLLIEKPPVALFDDMQGNWKPFGAINRMLTSETTTERLLGTNRSATVPTKALFLGTGNNIEPERDLRRRVVSIRLAPKTETPSFRSFRHDPIATIRQHRARAVSCVLSIINAYQAAGEPALEPKVPEIGTYGEWSRLCRLPLLWMGLPDPAQSLIEQVSHDPERQDLAELLVAWQGLFGTRSVTVRQLIAKAEDRTELMDALEELPVMDGRSVNRGKLGWFISKNRGRRADGRRIEPGDSSERRSWRVVID